MSEYARMLGWIITVLLTGLIIAAIISNHIDTLPKSEVTHTADPDELRQIVRECYSNGRVKIKTFPEDAGWEVICTRQRD
jgi:hypothetical protein